VDLYFFDFDKTLYDYNYRNRLPALSTLSGVSQYQLAKTWWAGGFELRAENGEWPTADEYLEQFAQVTGAVLSLGQWAQARGTAMTRIDGSIAAMVRARDLGTVSLLSNNPSPLGAALPILAPEVVEILGENILISYQMGVRKPEALAYELALAHYGARAQDSFMADDNAENVVGALAVGIHAHHFTTVDRLNTAIDEFAGRDR
jgi:glucose-1-phosphatase